MIKVGIAGGAGYTGGELLRILVHHPQVEVSFVNSKSNAGNYLWQVHQDLIGDTDLKFTSDLKTEIDILFLCLGHGDSARFLTENSQYVKNNKFRIIDLSQDFRLNGESEYGSFVYGLPELNREAIKKAEHIANPGCFATCIQLALLPLANHLALKEEIHITAITGSTGAGQKPTDTTHFSWRANNLSVYKAFEHQHLKEITKSLRQLQQDFSKNLNFIPYRGDFTRGIIASVHVKTDLLPDQAKDMYSRYYKDHPFTIVTEVNPDLKQIVNTNKALVYLEKHQDYLLIISCIDNLLKGASGQAIQNMNLMSGLPETLGLKLKSIGY